MGRAVCTISFHAESATSEKNDSIAGEGSKPLPALAGVSVEGVHGLLGGEVGDVHLVAHGAGEGVGDAGDHLHVGGVLLAQLIVAELEVLAVAAAGEGAEVLLAAGFQGGVIRDHVGVDLVHVGGVGEVHHVRGEAAAGAHVDFQGHDVALLAHVGMIGGQTEELEVHEPVLDAEGLHRRAAGLAGVLRQLVDDVVDGVVAVVDHVHDGVGGHVAGLEDGVAVGVDDGVVAVDLGGDELLHDIGHMGFLGVDEIAQILIGLELVGAGCAHAVVGLDDDGVAHDVDELLALIEIVHDVVAGGLDAHGLVVGLHLGLVLDALHVRNLEAGGDVEVGAQHGVALQPVLVVALQPVDAAVLADEERHGAVHLVVVLHGADLVVLGQAGAQLGQQVVVGAVTHAQHAQAVVLQVLAELPVVGGEVGGDEDEVFHCMYHLCVNSEFGMRNSELNV